MREEMDLYKLQDAAEELEVSASWLDKKIRAGKIAVIWMGGTRRITDAEIKRIKTEGVE